VGLKEQLDATKDGLRKLLGTRANVQAVKDEMTTVNMQCRNPQNVISTFGQISRVSLWLLHIFSCFADRGVGVHGAQKIQQVEEMVNNLTEMYA